MVKPGLWSAQFKTCTNFGFGMVTLANGKISGGDSAFYYLGTYTEKTPGILEADLEIKKYQSIAPSVSVFGPIDSFKIALRGTIKEDIAHFDGKLDQSLIQVELKKIADL